MLLHGYDIPVFGLASRAEQVSKYLAFNTVANNESGCCHNRQHCLESIAKLNKWMSLKPRPPSSFGFSICSLLSQWILCFPFWWFHQKRHIIAPIWSHRVFERSKQPIMKLGIACTTALIKISFPTPDKKFLIPPLHTLPDSVFQISKSIHLGPSHMHWQPQVLLIHRFLCNVQKITHHLLLARLCVLAKKYCWLCFVDDQAELNNLHIAEESSANACNPLGSLESRLVSHRQKEVRNAWCIVAGLWSLCTPPLFHDERQFH